MDKIYEWKMGMDRKLNRAKDWMAEKFVGFLQKKDRGISQVVIEAGLLIVGIALLVFFVIKIQPVAEAFIDACKEKALSIFDL